MEVRIASWQEKVTQHLADHPGTTARQIADDLNYDRKRITDVLAKLTSKGVVERKEDGPPHAVTNKPQLTFQLVGAPEPEVQEPEVQEPEVQQSQAPDNRPYTDKVVEYIRAHPGCTNNQIAASIPTSQGNTSSTTTSLWRQKILERTVGPKPDGRGRMQPLNYIVGMAPEGVPLIERTTPRPRRARVEAYNASIRAAQEAEAAAQEDAEELDAPDEIEQEAEEDASIARYEASLPAPNETVRGTGRDLEARAYTPQIAQGLDAMINKLAALIAERVVEQALETITSSLEHHLPAPKTQAHGTGIEDFYAKPPERNGKPSVLIVGLLPQQQAILQSDFHNSVKLSFFKDGTLKLMQQKAESVEHVLVICDFVSHAATEALKKHKDKTQLLRGGVTSVRGALASIVTGA